MAEGKRFRGPALLGWGDLSFLCMRFHGV